MESTVVRLNNVEAAALLKSLRQTPACLIDLESEKLERLIEKLARCSDPEK